MKRMLLSNWSVHNFACSLFLAASSLLALSGSQAVADEKPTAEQARFFESKIRPVLVRECFSCHSSEVGQVRGGLWLDTADAMRSGGDSGPAVVPGDLDSSLLWNAINHIDYAMPPRRKLSDEILADFRTWIEMGAPDPRVSEKIDVRSGITEADIEKGREFWSFKPPKRPSVPLVNSDWVASDIDRFVMDSLSKHNLKPASDANPSTLLRRMTFDLVGLPPTLTQFDKFEANWKKDKEQALQSAVDELLASPQFGERWGRHWLDLARYAESTGREVNMTYPYAWRYRDYVIDSFNRDKPYNRFVQEQIAGDLLPAPTDKQWAENLVATGFLTLGPKALNEQNGRQFELDVIDEQIDVTTRVMMGVSVACARCHDHKFDPIPQTDYYALSGIFRSMSTHYGTMRTQQNRRASNLIKLPVEDSKGFLEPLTRSQLEELKAELTEKQAELREAFMARRDRKSDDSKNPQQKFAQIAQLSTAAGMLQAKIDSYDKNGKPLSLCMAVQETTPTNARVLERGEFNKPGQEVERGFPKVLCSKPATIAKKSSGRLEFAKWVGGPENPLTARVMVNRVWQHLFGNAIVRTPEDFGSTGQPPSHPELLDYLAVEFMEKNWSVKQLVRTIVLSRAYQMDSKFDQASFEADPENKYLWRMEPKRLEAESIRDSMLTISGELDKSRPQGSIVAKGGTSVVRDGNLFALGSTKTSSGTASDIGTRMREQVAGNLLGSSLLKPSIESLDQPVMYRSVYLPIVRDNVPRSLDVFDFAESTMVVGQRESSNTPDQGLFFLNNSFVIDRAESMARRIMKETSNSGQQVQLAFKLAYGRPASQSELKSATEFYRSFQVESQQPSRFNDRRFRPGNRLPGSGGESSDSPELQKLSALCQSIMASAEFRFVN
jgi:Protein of unknown function (DUF1553)/Protein of unknown function (DUF1549)/Planctomycete cytochrome C